MDFGLDQPQQAIAELAGAVLGAARADEPRIAAALGGERGYDEALWKSAVQAGLPGLVLPEELGGDGFGAVEAGLVLREVGRQVLPLPALATLAFGVLPTVALATVEQRRAVLADVGDGAILTAALRTPPVRRDGAALVLDGAVGPVPYAPQAGRVLVPTEHGVGVIASGTPGVTAVRTPTATGAPEYSLRCEAVRIEPADVLGAERPDAGAVLRRYALAGAAAVADGVLAAALDLTAQHVRDRHQFGKPLATFQAVAQQIADVYVLARTMNLAATSAAWQLDAGAERAEDDCRVAAYWLAAEVPAALQVCHHLHGGLGVDVTYPLHRYYSRAKDLARLAGGGAARLAAIGAPCTWN